MMSLFQFLVISLGVYLLNANEVAVGKVCYLTQELDVSDGNRLRWIQPSKGMCSCTAIRPGGLSTVAVPRKTKPIYVDEPIFTDYQEEIHDHYGCHGKFTDCQALLDAGYTEDGIYTIYPFQNDEGIKVLCDMTNHTGWIMVQRRYNGSINFNRSWADYKEGFGSMDGEFWLGNEKLRKLTDQGNWTIRLDLTNDLDLAGHLIKSQFDIIGERYFFNSEQSSIQPTVGRYCGHKLGIGDRSIPDDRFTASSHWDSGYLPSNARLNLNLFWEPDNGLYEDSWLQVDMGTEPLQIEGVITQGWTEGDYCVTQYQVQYSINGNAWLYVNDTSLSAPKTFQGNTDGDTPVTNIFQQPIQARYIRIRPTAWNMFPALRIELLGCRVDDHCGRSLGMEDGSISDEKITTSSTDEHNCGGNPQGRLDVEGGWCPTKSDKNTAWFQVDLQQPTLIQGVITKGNNIKGYFVTEFIVSYCNIDQKQQYIGGTSEDNAKRFPGNSDEYTRVTNRFIEDIRARCIRIIPTGYTGNRPGLRIELLGCNERWFCLQHLGMGDGSIPDHRITASSTKFRSDGNCQPSNARLTQTVNSNIIGWCPESSDSQPWLQIDLETKVIVEGIMMQHGSYQRDKVDMNYELEHSDDQSTWFTMSSTQMIRRNKPITANTESIMFHPPITARLIRIILNQVDYSLWIRVELLGCKVLKLCGHKLGMADRSIPDDGITASSQWDSQHRPSNARLYLNDAWRPADGLEKDSWLQVDMGREPVQIEGVITQGHPQLDYYVTKYQVQYGYEQTVWQYVSSSSPQTFQGNTDGNTPVINTFLQLIQARYIRIIPMGWNEYPALRIELLVYTGKMFDMINGRPFSTYDKPNTDCPTLSVEGGWWFSGCCTAVNNNLNSEYIQPRNNSGHSKPVIRGTAWNGTGISKSEIKIRKST